MAERASSTQAERRSATRSALLNAAVESLLARGLAGTSTRAVADAAGVSQGALQYHFATKAELIDAALSEELTGTLARTLTAPVPGGWNELDGALWLLDQLWAFHQMPIFAPVLELLAIAHRDAEVARQTGRTLDLLLDQATRTARGCLPRHADHPGFPARLSAVMSTVRGAAAISAIPSDHVCTIDWPHLRHILAETLTSSPEPSRSSPQEESHG